MLAKVLKFAIQVLKAQNSETENPRYEQQAQFKYPAYPMMLIGGSGSSSGQKQRGKSKVVNPYTTTNLFVTIAQRPLFRFFLIRRVPGTSGGSRRFLVRSTCSQA
jgi:hypothetical protein